MLPGPAGARSASARLRCVSSSIASSRRASLHLGSRPCSTAFHCSTSCIARTVHSRRGKGRGEEGLVAQGRAEGRSAGDAPHPALRGEGRGAVPRGRAAGIPARRDRSGSLRRRRLPRARGRRRDRVDAPRARSHAREGHASERADGRAVRQGRRCSHGYGGSMHLYDVAAREPRRERGRSAAACRRSPAPRSPSSSAASRASRSHSSATAPRTSARSTRR